MDRLAKTMLRVAQVESDERLLHGWQIHQVARATRGPMVAHRIELEWC